jgi:hypothetical protein
MRAGVVCLALLAGACAPSGTAVLVDVSAAARLPAARLSALMTLAGITRGPLQVPLATPGFPPSHTFTIEVSPELHGTMKVHVVALDSVGASLAAGDGSAALVPGKVVTLPIALGGGGGGSDGGGGDGGSDSGIHDGGHGSDGAGTGPDLAGCTQHSDCATLVCKDDHTCAAPSDVAYVDNNGMSNAACLGIGTHDGSIAHPFCSIPPALDPILARSFVHIAGSSVSYGPLGATNAQWNGRTLVGPGRAATTLATLAADGSLGADALQFSITNMIFDGIDFAGQINCQNAGTIQLRDVSIHDSTQDGIYVGGCSISVKGGTIKNTQWSGVHPTTSSASVSLIDVTMASTGVTATPPSTETVPGALYLDGGATITLDRCYIGPANGVGLYAGPGTYTVTNTFIVDNVGSFAIIGAGGTGVFQFNTVANNKRGVNCKNTVIDACIFTGNAALASEFNSMTSCALLNNTITSTSPTQPAFVAGTYQLDPTKSVNDTCCIDKVTMTVDGGATTLSNHDYFANTRPRGAGWDIGAHEAK